MATAQGSEPVAIVTETFARKFLAGTNPDRPRRSRWTTRAGATVRRFRIVGLVQDTKYEELREDFTPIVFLPTRRTRSRAPRHRILVRSDLPLSTLLPVAGLGDRRASAPRSTSTSGRFRDILRDGLRP